MDIYIYIYAVWYIRSIKQYYPDRELTCSRVAPPAPSASRYCRSRNCDVVFGIAKIRRHGGNMVSEKGLVRLGALFHSINDIVATSRPGEVRQNQQERGVSTVSSFACTPLRAGIHVGMGNLWERGICKGFLNKGLCYYTTAQAQEYMRMSRHLRWQTYQPPPPPPRLGGPRLVLATCHRCRYTRKTLQYCTHCH